MKLKKIWIWSSVIAAVVLTILGMYGEDLSLLKRNEKTEETSYAYESGIPIQKQKLKKCMMQECTCDPNL